MTELYIRIKNGQPFEHPIVGDNFRQTFPEIDVNNLPAEFARFTRVDQPVVGVYEAYTVTYEWVDGNVTDAHHVRAMTGQEKLAKQDAVKADWVVNGHASWVFNEETCAFDPPIPYPTDGKRYRWDEPTVAWVEVVA